MADKVKDSFIPDDEKVDSFVADEDTKPIKKEPETSRFGATALGAAQGVTFGFADEIEAGLKSVFGDEKYEDLVTQSREKYKKAQEERPLEYTGAEVAAGIGSAFIPVVGQLGGAGVALRAGRAAKQAYAAKKGVDVASKSARAIEAAATGAVGGGIGAVGASEADVLAKQSPEAAAKLAADIGTGAAIGGAFGAGAQKVLESDTAKKIAGRVKESWVGKKTGEIADAFLSGGKENVEQGKLFIGNPEKVKEVEDAFKAGGFEKVKEARKNVKELVREKSKESREITKLNNEYNQIEKSLGQEISDLRRKEGLIKQEKALEIRKQTGGMQDEYDDVQKALLDLGPKIDQAESSIRQEVQKLSKSLDNQSAEATKNLYENQLNKIKELGDQRDKFVDKTLSNIAADEADAQRLQDAVTDMYSIYRDDFETAIKPVFTKIMRDEPRFSQMMNIIDNSEALANIKDAVVANKFSKADVIKLVENAKRNLWTADVSTPFGKARKDAYQILNSKMDDISPDYKKFNREMNKLMTTRDVLESSPLMQNRVVTKTGERGGETAMAQPFAAPTRPDIEGLPKEYVTELESKGFDVNLLKRQEDILKDKLTAEQLVPLNTIKTELTIKSNALERQIRELRRQVQIASGEEQRQLNQVLDKKIDDLNLYRNKMTSKLTKMREDIADKYAIQIGEAKDLLDATQEQVKQEATAYNLLRESPLSAEEVGRIATVGLTGKVIPSGIVQMVRPTPMARIKVYNAINRRFKNPALSAAIAPRLGQAFTRDEIVSLANMYNVDPSELQQELSAPE